MALPLIPLALVGGGAVVGAVAGWNAKRRPQEITEINQQNITSIQSTTQSQIFNFEGGSNVSNITIGQEADLRSEQTPIIATKREEGLINNQTLLWVGLGVGAYFVAKGAGVLK